MSNNETCCEKIYRIIDLSSEKEYELMKYHPEVRKYAFILHGYSYGMELNLQYCPWCGTKLPEDLGEQWCKVVKEELGIEEVFAEEWATLPEEYKTDQWWKKRGL